VLTVKKSFVALLVVLALIVMVSPGIVGRLAERSMEENLDWAAQESRELVVTSQGYDRGWFSSEGQHRVELKSGRLRDILQAYTGTENAGAIPALIIDTHLDHGLIPVASLSRDKGTLMPGLGSAVSSLSLETADGEVLDLPGNIYSTVGLTGEMQSNYVLAAGSFKQDDDTAFWGATEILVTTNPSSGAVGFDGNIESLAVDSMQETVEIRNIEFSGKQSPTPYGFRAGPANFSFESIDYGSNIPGEAIGPLAFTSTSRMDGDRLDARMTVLLKNAPFTDLGNAGINAELRIENADGRAIGNIKRAMEGMQGMQGGASYEAYLSDVETNAQRLLAAGISLHVDQLDLSLPQGLLSMKMDFTLPATDASQFAWTSVLLAMDASADISVPVELMDLITTMNPQAHTAIAMGFLRRKGDAYEMQASIRKGLLTVNGAPMSLPVPGLQ
jgi:uncharacterized protein YdgA (DUF945 family)